MKAAEAKKAAAELKEKISAEAEKEACEEAEKKASAEAFSHEIDFPEVYLSQDDQIFLAKAEAEAKV